MKYYKNEASREREFDRAYEFAKRKSKKESKRVKPLIPNDDEETYEQSDADNGL